MNCNKCTGRVQVERTVSDDTHIELSCLGCGKRWMLDKKTNRLGRYLASFERSRENAVTLTV